MQSPLKNGFCSLTFEEKEKREWWRNRKVLSFAPFVSRLSLSHWVQLCIEALCGLCGWKAALLDPDQVIDSTTQECPISFFLFCSFFPPLRWPALAFTVCWVFLRQHCEALFPRWAPAASISSHTVPVRLTDTRHVTRFFMADDEPFLFSSKLLSFFLLYLSFLSFLLFSVLKMQWKMTSSLAV